MSAPHERLDREMAARGVELKKKWVQVAREAGISTAALGAIRRGEYKPSPHTARALDAALEWELGSVEAILADGDPTPLQSSQPPERDADKRLEEILSDPEIRAAFARRIARMFDAPPSPPSNEERDRQERSDTA